MRLLEARGLLRNVRLIHPTFRAVYHVLLHLKSHLALGDFFRIVDDRPRAAVLLEIYAREQDREMLKDFYYQDDRRKESARLMLEEADRTKVSCARSIVCTAFLIALPLTFQQDLVERMAAVKAAGKFFSEDKDCAFESRVRLAVRSR